MHKHKIDRSGFQDLLSRRQFAQAALASTGLFIAGSAFGQTGQTSLALTAESPMGPFYPLNPLPENDADLTRLAGRAHQAAGRVIELSGRVLDPGGNPIVGAQIELWQANAAGRYLHELDPATAPLDPDFQGYARLTTGSDGSYRIRTIKPGGYDSPIGHRPPHLHFDLRGRTHRSIAQMYFPDEAEGNARDTLFAALGEGAGTSVARQMSAEESKFEWDVVLMG